MIVQAVYEILDNASLGVNAIRPLIASQGDVRPFIVYDVSSIPEDNKDGSNIEHHRIDVKIYTNKEKLKANGVFSGYEILEDVKTALDRFSGTQATHKIDTIIYQDQRQTFDTASQSVVTEVTFRLREEV